MDRASECQQQEQDESPDGIPNHMGKTAGDWQKNGKGRGGSPHGTPDMTSQERACPDFKGSNSFKNFNTYVDHVKISYRGGGGRKSSPTVNCLLYKHEEQSSIQEPM